MRRAALALAGAAAALTLVAAPAAAQDAPAPTGPAGTALPADPTPTPQADDAPVYQPYGSGTANTANTVPQVSDCKTPPVPEVPGRSGTFGDFLGDTPRQLPPAADPFRLPSTTTIYEQYGMAGLTWNTYDLGCVPDPQWAAAPTTTLLGNLGMDVAKLGIGVTAATTRAGQDPTWLSTFDSLVTTATTSLYQVVTRPAALVLLPVLGVIILTWARRAQMGRALGAALFALVALAAAAAVSSYPLRAASVADASLGATVAQITAGVTQTQGNPVDAATAASVDAVLWPRWKAGMLGCSDCPVAARYAPDLLRASALTWREAAQAETSPGRARQITEEKNRLWRDTAARVQADDPAAYEHLIGHEGSARIAAGLLAVLGMLATQPMLWASALLVLASYLVLRLLVMLFPLIAPAALIPATAGLPKGAALSFAAAIVNVVVFGTLAAVQVLGMRILLAPATGLAPWLGFTLVAVWSVSMWMIAKPFRRLLSLTHNPNPLQAAGSAGRHAVAGRAQTALGLGAGALAAGSVVKRAVTRVRGGSTAAPTGREAGEGAEPRTRAEHYRRDPAQDRMPLRTPRDHGRPPQSGRRGQGAA